MKYIELTNEDGDKALVAVRDKTALAAMLAKGYTYEDMPETSEPDAPTSEELAKRREFFDGCDVDELIEFCDDAEITPGDEWKKSDYVTALTDSDIEIVE